jgi:undecaprenol kinase
MKGLGFWRRFKFALGGVGAAWRSERSFRTQAVLGLVAAVVLAAVHPPLFWVALWVLSAASVLACELINTALERLADRLHPEMHPAIQMAKDCAAGAVLLAATAALIIGALAVAVGLGWIKG